MNAAAHSGLPLVSCVVIFHNAGPYIGEALESVASQTYEHWELILVDDGSTDDSRSVAEAFARRHAPRVRILEHPGRTNRGKSVSRNLGFSAAKGEFIAMLDADDAWLPDKLSEQVALMAANPDADIVYGRVEFWYSWTGRPRDARKAYTSKLAFAPGTTQDGRRLLETILRKMAVGADEVTPYPSTMMFRTALLARSGGFDPDFKVLYDDVVFFVKAFLVARIHASGQIWTRYRVAPDDTYSPTFETALTAGEWSPKDVNEPERRMLERAEQYIAAAVPRSGRLRFAVQLALLRYRFPPLRRLWAGLADLKRALKRTAAAVIQGWWIHVLRRPPRPDYVHWGSLQHRCPLRTSESPGSPALDRHFARLFCERHADCITGDVLEFGDAAQTRRFGKNTASVTIAAGNSVIDDGWAPPSGAFYDCVIAIDLIQYQSDVEASLARLRALLRPGGSLIISFPALIPSIGADDLWRFTAAGVRNLLSRGAAEDYVEIAPCGSAAAAIAMIHGLGLRDLDQEFHTGEDDGNAVLVMARITRPKGPTIAR